MKGFYTYSFGTYKIFQTPNLWNSYQNYNYILVKDQQAVIFDPGDFDPINKTIESNQLEVKAIYLTHHHQDHAGATLQLQKKWNCPVYGFIKDQPRLPHLDFTFKEDQELLILGTKAQVLFLPGHTLGLCAFYFKEQNWLFSNDLIFSLGCGRVFEGTFEQMHNSLQKVAKLPNDTLLFCSHEYTKNNLDFALHLFDDDPKLLNIKTEIFEKIKNHQPTVPTKLSYEKEYNPFLRCHENYIRKKLNMKNQTDTEVFSRIRKLKDNF